MKNKLSIYFLVPLLLVALSIYVLPFKMSAVNSLNVNDYSIVAGVIRNNGSCWSTISDKGHEPVGINHVTQNDEYITIEHAKSSKVITMSVTVDETMASEGYRVGASVGLEETRIYIYDKANKLVRPKDYASSKGNIWIYGLFKK